MQDSKLLIDLVTEFERLEPQIKAPIVNGYETIIGTDPNVFIPLHTLLKGFQK